MTEAEISDNHHKKSSMVRGSHVQESVRESMRECITQSENMGECERQQRNEIKQTAAALWCLVRRVCEGPKDFGTESMQPASSMGSDCIALVHRLYYGFLM